LRSFGNAITNANSHGHGNSNCYSHSHGYAYGKTQSLTATTPDSGAQALSLLCRWRLLSTLCVPRRFVRLDHLASRIMNANHSIM
jgi:hypothetical protein